MNVLASSSWRIIPQNLLKNFLYQIFFPNLGNFCVRILALTLYKYVDFSSSQFWCCKFSGLDLTHRLGCLCIDFYPKHCCCFWKSFERWDLICQHHSLCLRSAFLRHNLYWQHIAWWSLILKSSIDTKALKHLKGLFKVVAIYGQKSFAAYISTFDEQDMALSSVHKSPTPLYEDMGKAVDFFSSHFMDRILVGSL